MTTERAFNFSAGPAVLPEPVLAQVQREMMALPGARASILEISHRGGPFKGIIAAAEANIRKLLAVPEDYSVLFLQGGGRLLFSAIAMNLMSDGHETANYILTGSWGRHAAKEAAKVGEVHTAWDGKATNYNRIPQQAELNLAPDAAYTYYVSNETIEGVQFAGEPDVGGAPLVCDASSDFMHKPLDVSRYGIVYACAQKNIGPAGVTVVVVKNELLERSSDSLPVYLNFKEQAAAGSLLNTAPTFAIYVVRLVTDWLLNEVGGLERMYQLNQAKAKLLYDAIDQCEGFYEGHAERNCRSLMNVCFRLPSENLTKKFLAEAEQHNMVALAGHRSVGGIRASIYNAMPLAGVQTLHDFMLEFRSQNAT